MNTSNHVKFLVAWDFPKRPSTTFYRVLNDEFGTSHPAGAVYLIQRSVALCRDDFTADCLGALAERFGARVICYAIDKEAFGFLSGGAHSYIERILSRRLHQRGWRRRKP